MTDGSPLDDDGAEDRTTTTAASGDELNLDTEDVGRVAHNLIVGL